MTLIVTAISDDSVVQVVDRRLTMNGIPIDDLAMKAVCGVCRDASFSLAYTGLVTSPLPTGEWLVDFLGANHLLSQPLPAVLNSLAEALTCEFARFRQWPDGHRRLTVSVAGFGPPGPFAATVTNQEDELGHVLAKPENQFRVSWLLRNNKKMHRLDLILHGAEGAIDDELVQTIAKIRRGMFRKSGIRIASALVAIVRRAAKRATYGHFLGPHCISIVHTRASLEITCDDHFQGCRPTTHLPYFVSPSVSFKRISIEPG
jgi:hypothetical protein